MFGISYSTKETNFKSYYWWGGCNEGMYLIIRVVAAIILHNLGVQHFSARQGESGHMLCTM